MHIDEARDGGVLLIAPSGRVDSTTAVALEHRLMDLVGSGEHRVDIDFHKVDYISSAGLRVMIALARRLHEVRRGLALCALSDPVRLVFDLGGLLHLFVVERTREQAVARVPAS
jgi:stage II sporulation protein AA (anti-sigma F factor antagonist)